MEEVLFETRVLAAIDNRAVMLLTTVGLPLSMSTVLFLHKVLIEHFLVADLVIYLVV